MLDNFRKRDVSPSARPQSPYSRMQEALTSPGADSPKPDTPFKAEAPKPVPREEIKPVRPDDESGSKLIVGPDIKLRGAEITDCDTLIVQGRVEASMNSRVIQISERGVFVGKAEIDVAEIRGSFEGELTARKQLLVRATGKLSGKIRYGKVAIEEGGELSGDVAALAETPGVARSTDPRRNAPSTAPAVGADAQLARRTEASH